MSIIISFSRTFKVLYSLRNKPTIIQTNKQKQMFYKYIIVVNDLSPIVVQLIKQSLSITIIEISKQKFNPQRKIVSDLHYTFGYGT